MKGLVFLLIGLVVTVVLVTTFVAGDSDTIKTETERIGQKTITNLKMVESGQP